MTLSFRIKKPNKALERTQQATGERKQPLSPVTHWLRSARDVIYKKKHMPPKLDSCYMCEDLATSKEHVPPKCLFPEQKDIGDNYRLDLITVPSCEKHNSKKSKDDEFLMVSLAGIIGNNSIGYMHKLGKVDRAIKRSSNRLIQKVFIKKEKYYFPIKGNKFIEVIWGTPDIDRVKICFEHIAYGLFFNHYQKRFKGTLKMILGYLHHKEPNSTNFKAFIKHRMEIDLKGKKKFGENPDIFYYQFIEPDEFDLSSLKICFYGGIEVYVAFIPSTAKLPGNLAMELMNKGIKTFISLEGKSYEFN